MSLHRILVILVTTMVMGSAWVASSKADFVPLTWTAPGEDSLVGRAARYDLRYSARMITAQTFLQATEAQGMPLPASPGTRQSYVLDGLPPGDSCYIAIKTVDQAGNWSAMSNVISRMPQGTIQAPTAAAPVSPEDGATGVAIEPTLTWQASSGATGYRLQVARAADFSGPVVDQSGIVATSYAVGRLANDSPYYWRVQASGAGGASAWSSVRSFRTVAQAPMAPLQPDLMSPEDGETGVAIEPMLTWQASSGATGYRLQMARAADFSGPVVDQSGIVATSYAVGRLANDSPYYWRVQASGAGGASAWSSVRSFRTVAETVARALPGVSFSAPWPNPARELSRFECALPEAAQVRVEVFDLVGRRVRLLVDESCAAGPRELAFDLRDDHGLRLVAGVYLVRAQLGSTAFRRRLVIVP